MNSNDQGPPRPGSLPARLRELRTTAGITGGELAEKIGMIQPKVSKIENGRQLPTAEEVTAWVRACGRDAELDELLELREESEVQHRSWRRQLRSGGQASIQKSYDELVRSAKVIRNAEVSTVPGLLQTAEYARHQFMQGVRLHEARTEEEDEVIAAKMARQSVLYDRGRRFEFVITEACLLLLYCPADVMLEQLDRLLSVAAGNVPAVWLGIIPFGVELPVVPQNRFIIIDDLVMVEGFVGETEYVGGQAAKHLRAMDALVEEAVTGEPARRLITRAMDEIRRLA